MKSGKKCDVVGCNHLQVARGFCSTHYKRFARHGSVDPTRPADWGAREKHPLYGVWCHLRRHNGAQQISERWIDFWNFAADLADARPSKNHRLKRIDEKLPFSKENCFWREPKTVGTNERKKQVARDYIKNWRLSNPEKCFDRSLRRYYGIGIKEYEALHKIQSGLCAICDKPETAIDRHSKKPRRLAVDHCHTTGRIRGLLCTACNTGIGTLEDDVDRLRRAIHYLQRGKP